MRIFGPQIALGTDGEYEWLDQSIQRTQALVLTLARRPLNPGFVAWEEVAVSIFGHSKSPNSVLVEVGRA